MGLAALSAQANVVIGTTRVVFNADKPITTVQLQNTGTAPSLIQSWLDFSEFNAVETGKKAPFIITPPVTRIEADTRQTLRIRYTGEPLAQDRETLFYLNILDVPPKPKKEQLAESGNYIQFAVRSRLKFFFRPANLPYSVNNAYEKVTWHIIDKKLVAKNPTPYFITYSGLSLLAKNAAQQDLEEGGMVAPFSEHSFQLSKQPLQADSVEWHLINDYGGSQKGRSALQY